MLLPLRIDMFGGLRAYDGKRRIDRFQTQKTGALLAYLALHMPRTASREALAELLWPDGDATAIRNRLNQAVSSLRRQLHPPDSPANAVLIAELQMLSLNDSIVTTDVQLFEKACSVAKRAETPTEKLRQYRLAADIYQGELLEGYYEDWLVPMRMRLGEMYLQCLTEVVRSNMRTGEPEEAIPYAHRLLQAEPTMVQNHCTLMELFLRAGQPAAVLRHRDQALELLHSHGVEWPAEAEALVQRAERDQRRQVVAPVAKRGRATPLEEVDAGQAAICGLPRTWDAFVGREQEVNTLLDSFQRGERFVTVLGLGGAGKTRLAIEVAWKLTDKFPGGIVYVSLGGVEATASVASLLFTALELTGADKQASELLTVIRALQERDRVLIMLDAAEELNEHRRVEVDSVRDRVPNAAFLITSRQPLDIRGERQLTLTPLSLPSGTGPFLPAELALCPSVQLFVARAQVIKADFQLTERIAEPIALLVRKLEGIPLAIELAAGWARTLSPYQILEQLQLRSDILASRRKDVSERHRSMRAALEGSFALLTTDEQRAFVRLCMFHGWDHQSAQAVCPGDDILALLEGLASKSLIVVEEARLGTRFRMLDLVRQFGRAQSSPDLDAEVGWMHADIYLKLALDRERSDWSVALDEESANLLAALEWLTVNGELERAARLVRALTPYWEMRGRISQGISWCDTLLDIPELTGLARAQVEVAGATLLWVRGATSRSATLLESALPVLREQGDYADVVEGQFILGLERHRRGEYAESIKLATDNLERGTAAGDRLVVARAHVSLGNSAIEQGRRVHAEAHYLASLSAAESLGDPHRIGSAMVNLGNLALLQDNLSAARTWLERALPRLLSAGHRWHSAMALLVFAKIHNAEADYSGAIGCLREAYRLAPDTKLTQWRIMLEQAWNLTCLGRWAPAAQLYGVVERLQAEGEPGQHPVEMADYEARVQLLRRQASVAEIDSAWQVGRTLTPEEVSALVLAPL